MDRDTAFDTARDHIAQIEKEDSHTIDEVDLTAEDAELGLETVRQSVTDVTILPLENVAFTAQKIQDAIAEHHAAIREARLAGASLKDITAASHYSSRQSIHDVLDGKKK